MKELCFKDDDNIEYVYNDDTGLIFQNNKEMIQMNLKYYDSLKSEIDKSKESSVVKNDTILKNSVQLIFKMSEACNMRCKYCIYSDYYPKTADYGSGKMTIDVAKSAVKIFMERFNSTFQKGNVKLKPVFTFYGGEPLIEYSVIKQIVSFIKENYHEYNCIFSITTNGLLLNKDIADFLIENNFLITISLDGNEKINDRNRVDVNGGGTYSKIFNNIMKYLIDYGNVVIASCYDYKTPLSELANFVEKYDRQNNGIFPHLQKLTMINDIDTSYYKQFTEEDVEFYKKNINDLRKEYIHNAINNKKQRIVVHHLIGSEILFLYDRIKFINQSNYCTICSNCTPGEKLYITPTGDFYICEKVPENEKYIVGNVSEGININKINDLITSYNNDILKKCKNCNIRRLCSMCFAQTIISDDNKFTIPNEKQACELRKEYITNRLKDMVYIMKNNPSYFENELNSIVANHQI